jgi:hypothetical protein
VSRITSPAAVLVLAVALAAAPLMWDQCAAACDAVHADRASASALACHHTATADGRMASPSRNCGHDHHGTLATLTAATAPASVPIAPVAAIIALVKPVPAEPSACTLHQLSSSPPPIITLAARARSLRI